MPRTPARFTQADVTRAVKGAEQAGLRVTAIETKPDGSLVIYTVGEVDPPRSAANAPGPVTQPERNEWDEVLPCR